MRDPDPAARPKPSRRQLLRAGAGLALVLAAGALAATRTRGYPLAPGRRLVWMTPWQLAVVEHAARRITAADVAGPAAASTPGADDLDVAGFFDAWVARMPAQVRRDLGRFLAYLEHLAPLASGHGARFTRLGPREQDDVLASVEASRHALLRAGFDGLKSLVFIGYYRDPRAWAIVGYDGPLVGRPAGGWR
jgi:hypothetical protein